MHQKTSLLMFKISLSSYLKLINGLPKGGLLIFAQVFFIRIYRKIVNLLRSLLKKKKRSNNKKHQSFHLQDCSKTVCYLSNELSPGRKYGLYALKSIIAGAEKNQALWMKSKMKLYQTHADLVPPIRATCTFWSWKLAKDGWERRDR